jgi:hypothetical protein
MGRGWNYGHRNCRAAYHDLNMRGYTHQTVNPYIPFVGLRTDAHTNERLHAASYEIFPQPHQEGRMHLTTWPLPVHD